MERVECSGCEWTESEGSGTAIEGHSMVESRRRLVGGSKGVIEVRND